MEISFLQFWWLEIPRSRYWQAQCVVKTISSFQSNNLNSASGKNECHFLTRRKKQKGQKDEKGQKVYKACFIRGLITFIRVDRHHLINY